MAILSVFFSIFDHSAWLLPSYSDANLEPWSHSWDLSIATMDPDENANPGTPANIAFRYRSDPFQAIWNAYFGDMKAEMGFNAPETNAAARRRVVHTAMHGVGHKFAQQIFKTLGLPKVGRERGCENQRSGGGF